MNDLFAPRIGDAADRAFAARVFEILAERTGDGVGITRTSYGPGESIALDVIDAEARAVGLHVERDRGSNLVVTLPGQEPSLPFIACGSHLDSVPQGGNFDGAAGVIAGLSILRSFVRDGFRPKRTIKLYALRGEESARFGKAYMGSSALFGRLSQSDLLSKSQDTNQTLFDCMRSVGADVETIAAAKPLLDVGQIAAWIELHIEQGPVLVARELPVAIVTGIRGNVRHRIVECIGEAGHSGAVPRWLRRDAVFATSELITHLDRHWRTMQERGRDIVVTAGIMTTNPDEHAIARIPGRVTFSFEVRSQSKETLEAFYDLFLSETQLIKEDRGVEFRLDRRVESMPAVMDKAWISRLQSHAQDLGLLDEVMPSGAGHDTAVFANAGIPSAMIFVRNTNGSHNPAESMDLDDFGAGVELMRRAIKEAAE